MKSFRQADSLFHLSYFSSPFYDEERGSLFYVKTYIDVGADDYATKIIEYNFENKKEIVWVDDGGKSLSPSVQDNKLLFTSNMAKGNVSQVYLFDLITEEQIQLTYSEFPVSRPKWVPNSDYFVYSSQTYVEGSAIWNEKQAPVYRYKNLQYFTEGTGFVNQNVKPTLLLQNVYRSDTEKISYLVPNPYTKQRYEVSSSGDYILYENRVDEDNPYDYSMGIFQYNRHTKETTHLTNEFNSGEFVEMMMSPDERYVAMVGSTKQAETPPKHPGLYLYDVENSELNNVTQGVEKDFMDHALGDFAQNLTGSLVQWHPNGQSFYGLASEEGDVKLYQCSLDGDLKQISPQNTSVKEYVVNSEGDVFAFFTKYDEPIALYVYSEDTWTKVPLSETDYSEYAFAKYHEVDYKAEDGGRIHGYLVTPPNFDETRKYPFLLNIHGGPNMMHSSNFYHEIQHQAAKGYVVLLLNPRGSYGYGQSHVMGSYGKFGEDDYTDLMTAVDEVINENGFIDMERLFVTGGSYGGYMTNWIVSHTNRFKAAVTQRSVSNLISMVGTSDIGHFFYNDMAGADITQPKKLWEKSPLAYAQNVETPLLVMHSTDDVRTPFEQGQQWYAALKKFDKEVELLIFPDSNHNLSRGGRPSYRMQRLNAMMEWFEKYDVKEETYD